MSYSLLINFPNKQKKKKYILTFMTKGDILQNLYYDIYAQQNTR
jgi:hypothetical protein